MEHNVDDIVHPRKTIASEKRLTEQLDFSVISYLELLEQYNESYEELQSHIKAAFFDLAKSKLALGPSRVGSNSYDLTSHLPTKTILIQDQLNSQDHAKQTRESKLQSRLSFMLANNQHEQSSLTNFKQSLSSSVTSRKGHLGPESAVRKRKPIQDADKSSPNSPTEKSKENPLGGSDQEEGIQGRSIQQLPDPIHQFSALPPPSLRSAQTQFSKSLESVVKLCNLRLRLFEVERLVQFYKESKYSAKNTDS